MALLCAAVISFFAVPASYGQHNQFHADWLYEKYIEEAMADTTTLALSRCIEANDILAIKGKGSASPCVHPNHFLFLFF